MSAAIASRILGCSISLPAGASARAHRAAARAVVPGIERVTVYRRIVSRTRNASPRGGAYVSFEMRKGADATPEELHRLEAAIVVRAAVQEARPRGASTKTQFDGTASATSLSGVWPRPRRRRRAHRAQAVARLLVAIPGRHTYDAAAQRELRLALEAMASDEPPPLSERARQ